jgi:hypothetical protein
MRKPRTPEQVAAKNAALRAARATPEGREARVAVELRSRTGMSVEQFRALLAAQDGKCAICRAPFELATAGTPSGGRKPPCVDHDHATGKIRGLLCRGCNTAEGWVAKNGKALAAYLAAPPADVLDFV